MKSTNLNNFYQLSDTKIDRIAMGKDKDEPQEEYSVEKVLQKRIRGGKVRSQ